MDSASLSVAAGSFGLNATYVAAASEQCASRQRRLQSLLAHKRLPPERWSDGHIVELVQQLAALDSNNNAVQLGGGEREGRVLSPLVSSRHFGLAHGIGRSGDLTAQQPKAIGSSLMQQLTTALAQHALQLAGLTSAADCLLMPVATGMSLTIALMALQREREARDQADQTGQTGRARYVVMPRIDQKTCIKCVLAAGLQPTIVQPTVAEQSDAVVTEVAAVERRIAELGVDSVLCVLSVTSCFAPRGADDVVGLAVLCERLGVPHLINNAYGVQSRRLMAAIDRAARKGRVDAVVQSMDKNFMVPVGGAIVCQTSRPQQRASQPQQPALPTSAAAQPTSASSSLSSSSLSPAAARPRARPGPSLVSRMARLYPGRASSSCVTDLLMTLLTLGERGWLALLDRRALLFDRLRLSLDQLAARHHERLLRTAGHNDISLALSLTGHGAASSLSLLGSMLFRRGVSGVRVWQPGAPSPFPALPLDGWGGHGWPASSGTASTERGCGYVSMACALGMEQHEVDALVQKLDDTLTQWRKKSDSKPRSSDEAVKEQPASTDPTAASGLGHVQAGVDVVHVG